MNPGNEIVKELQELHSPLAQMPRTMPFVVPEGYFESFPVAAITATEDPIPDFPKTMPFAVPQGYFESFARSVTDLAAAEPSLDLPRETPFEVPSGYFEQFSASILDKVEQPSFGKTNAPAFDVPAGYFDGFATGVLARLKEEDAPAASSPTKQETKVIDLRPQWKAIRWAAAAMLVMGIGIGSFMRFAPGHPVGAHESASLQLAQLDKGLIRSYVQQHIDEFDTELLAENSAVLNQSTEKNINKLKSQDIKKYLDDADLGDVGIN